MSFSSYTGIQPFNNREIPRLVINRRTSGLIACFGVSWVSEIALAIADRTRSGKDLMKSRYHHGASSTR